MVPNSGILNNTPIVSLGTKSCIRQMSAWPCQFPSQNRAAKTQPATTNSWRKGKSWAIERNGLNNEKPCNFCFNRMKRYRGCPSWVFALGEPISQRVALISKTVMIRTSIARKNIHKFPKTICSGTSRNDSSGKFKEVSSIWKNPK